MLHWIPVPWIICSSYRSIPNCETSLPKLPVVFVLRFECVSLYVGSTRMTFSASIRTPSRRLDVCDPHPFCVIASNRVHITFETSNCCRLSSFFLSLFIYLFPSSYISSRLSSHVSCIDLMFFVSPLCSHVSVSLPLICKHYTWKEWFSFCRTEFVCCYTGARLQYTSIGPNCVHRNLTRRTFFVWK
jgi:hypothetical protein